MTRPLSVAVLVKQVPLAEEFRLGADGRLVRDGADIGIVGDWRQAARLLTEALARELARGNQPRAGAAPVP